MIKLQLGIELNYQILQPGCEFILNIHAAHTRNQTVLQERLELSQPLPPNIYTDATTGNRLLRITAGTGPLRVRYDATVELKHHIESPQQLMEVPVARLPPEVLSYLYPSRYCQSDRLNRMAMTLFGNLYQGYGRVQAIRDWVNRQVVFTPNTSNSTTSSVDTLIEGVGVCRDFAHLMIAMCRAVNIPARFATGIDYGTDPALGPTDFHAYVEAYLGNRWYIFDPSGLAMPMGFVRFGTGRDAADTAFATIFGAVTSTAPLISIQALTDNSGRYSMPFYCTDALATDGGA